MKPQLTPEERATRNLKIRKVYSELFDETSLPASEIYLGLEKRFGVGKAWLFVITKGLPRRKTQKGWSRLKEAV